MSNERLMEALGLSEDDAEEIYLQQEINDRYVAIGRDTDALDQLDRVREAIQDISLVAAGADRVSLENRALMAVTSRVMLDGSERLVKHLFPEYETGEYVVSQERMSEFAKQLWERIKAAIISLISSIAEFWKRMGSMAGLLKVQVKRLRMRAEARLGRTIRHPTFELGREVNRLTINGNAPNDGTDIVRLLSEGRRQLNVILGEYGDNVLKTGDSLMTAYSAAGNDALQYLEGIMQSQQTLRLQSVASSLKAIDYRDARFSPGEVMRAPVLAGNKCIFLRPNPQPFRNNPTLLSMAEAARFAGISLDAAASSPPPQLNSYEMRTFGADVVVQITTLLLAILEQIEAFNLGKRGKLSSKSKAVLDKVNAVKDRLYRDAVSETDSQAFESAFRFSVSYAKLATTSYNPVVTHLILICRAAITACNKSLYQLI